MKMKTKLFKGLASAFLALLMLMTAIPLPAMAATYDGDEKVTSTEFELLNYAYGETVLSGNARGENGIVYQQSTKFYESNEANPANPADLFETTDDFFKADKQYYCEIRFSEGVDIVGFADTLTVTLKNKGALCEQLFEMKEREDIIVVYKLPVLEAVPVGIDYTINIEQGGNVAPGVGNFELEVLNTEDSSNTPIADFTIGGKTVSTNGTGGFDKKLTIKSADYSKVFWLTYDGIIVKQKKGTAEGWTYDESVWYVKRHDDGGLSALNEETQTMPGISFECYKGKMVEGEFQPDSQEYTDKITFTNTYTKNEAGHTHNYLQNHNEKQHWNECACGDVKDKEIHKFGDWKVTTKATETAKGDKERICSICGHREKAVIDMLTKTEAPKTGDSSSAALWMTMLLIGSLGAAGVMVYSKKKKALIK